VKSTTCATNGGVTHRRTRVRALPVVVAVLAAVLLPACAPGDPAAAHGIATDPPAAASALPATTPKPTPAPTPLALRVAVRAFKEPNDYAHRNYCGAGATEVLLSAWMAATPDVETVARGIRLNPSTGATGADTAAGINALLHDVVTPQLGADRYRGEHITTLDGVVSRLRADLGSAQDMRRFGHTTPVMLQAMTKTLPGWRGWQATHMITVSSAQLGSGDPNVDTVTYAETPSTVAGYNGPDFQTITLSQLWVAMQAFIVDSPSDPVNVIS
jgi:hypothetical protein